MATTPTKWSALSIHERIRAMNDTLDSVESSQGGEDMANRMIVPPTQDSTPKRSSVVDIWRQREAKGEATSDNNDQPNQPVHKEAPTFKNVSPQSTKKQSTSNSNVRVVESHLAALQRTEDTTRPRMARRPASSRGIASASPAPPPLPMRRGEEQQQTDITIVPSPSNQSSASSISSRRSTRVIQAWERQKEGEVMSHVDTGQRTLPKTSTDETDKKEPIIITETPSRRSVVDIWQNKASSPKASNSWIKKTPPSRSPKTTGTPATLKHPRQLENNRPGSSPKWRAALKSVSSSNQSDEAKVEPETPVNRWTRSKKVEPTVPKWNVPLKAVPKSPAWKAVAEKKAQTEEALHRPIAKMEQHRPAAEEHVRETEPQDRGTTPTKSVKGSVLDRWKVAQPAPVQPGPQWKTKVKPPVEHVVVQDEPTASETEMPSDDEVDFIPQEASTMMETTKVAITPKKPGKITDRWLQAKGVSQSKPPVWTKPSLNPVKPQHVTKESEQDHNIVAETNAFTNNESKEKVLVGGARHGQDSESKTDLSSHHTHKVIENNDDDDNGEQQTFPTAIQCESATAHTTPSPLQITPPSPMVSKLVEEFGHRTPVAGLRKAHRATGRGQEASGNSQCLSSPRAVTNSNAPTTPSENHSVPDHLSGLVRSLEAHTPSGKKRLSIADRWTAKISASKSNSASKNDVPIEDQPTDEEEDTAWEGEDRAVDFPNASFGTKSPGDSTKSESIKSSIDLKDCETVPDGVQGTPPSVRSGVANRWKKRIAATKEATLAVPPQSPQAIEQGDATKSLIKVSPSTSSIRAMSPINHLSALHGTSNDVEGSSDTQLCRNEDKPADSSSLLQKLSFSSDTQSNHESSDVEIVLNAPSSNTGIEEGITLTPAGQKNETEREDKVEPSPALATKQSTPSLPERRGRQLSKHRAQYIQKRSFESKSEVGSSGRYPDFQKLVDRSRKLSSSLSPTREPPANDTKPAKPETQSASPVVTHARIQKPFRSLSASRSKQTLDVASTDASPIDMITEWNHKLVSSNNVTSTQRATSTKISSPPRPKAKSIHTPEPATNRRSRKNFAHLGRKHAAKRPQVTGSQDEDSMDDELSQPFVQSVDSNRPINEENPPRSGSPASREDGDSRKYSATPTISNRRRSWSSGKRSEDAFERQIQTKGSEASASTRKLAIEKSQIKKKLNSRRKSRDSRGSMAGSRSESAATSVLQVTDTSNSSSFDHHEPPYDHGEDYDAILLPDSAGDNEFDQALEHAASSGSSPSSLANKAERVLQERRRKAKNPDPKGSTDLQRKSLNDGMEEFANRVREGIPAQQIRQEQPRRKTLGVDDVSSHGARSLSSRYNVSSRFIEQESEVSMASGSMQGARNNDEESSCLMSATSTNASPPLAPSDTRKPKQASTPKQRRNRHKASDGSVASSVNTANMSAWDASRVSDIASLMSFDLKKFANAVDERVAVLRDFVGGPTMDGDSSHLPQEVDMEMEDVAIEVEYVEEDGDELSNSPSDLGLLSSQSEDRMRKGYV